MQWTEEQHQAAAEALLDPLESLLGVSLGDCEDALAIVDLLWSNYSESARHTAEREGNLLAADIVGMSPQQMVSALSFLTGCAGATAVLDAIQYATRKEDAR